MRKDEPLDLLIWRDQFSKLILAYGAIFLPLAMIYNLPFFITERKYGLIAIDAACWLLMLSQLFGFGRPSRVRSYLTLSALYTMTVAFIVSLGPFGARPAWLVMCTIFAGVLFGRRGAIAAGIFDAAILWALYGVLEPGNKAWGSVYSEPLAIWIAFVINTPLLALISGLAVALLLNRLEWSFRDQIDAAAMLRKRSEELEKAYELVQGEVEQRKIAEKGLIQSEAQYRLLAENATDVIWTADMALNVTYMSPLVYRTRGYTPQEVMTLKLTDHLAPNSLALATRVLAEELAVEAQEDRDLKKAEPLNLNFYTKTARHSGAR